MVKTFTFSVLFLLISVLIQGIIKGLSAFRRTEGIRLTDQAVGAGLGAVQAIFLLVLMVKLTGWIVEHGENQIAFFNQAEIQKSVLFQHLSADAINLSERCVENDDVMQSMQKTACRGIYYSDAGRKEEK